MPGGLVERWFPAGAQVSSLHGGGFSGSHVFLVRRPDERAWVLKAFAEGTTRPRAESIHAVVHHLRASEAFDLIPPVLRADDGCSVVASDDGRFWEMMAYVDGLAVATPSARQVVAAMHALSRVHRSLGLMANAPPHQATSLGVTARVERSSWLLERSWKDLLEAHAREAERSHPIARALAAANAIFDTYGGPDVLREILRLQPPMVTCQTVLRDIWNEHLLFDGAEGSRIAGIIDLHAVGIDTPATDVARLLGSWLPIDSSGDDSWWQSAFDAYESHRELGTVERQLIPFLAATSVIFGLDNWFRWTLAEERTFFDGIRVLSRIEGLVARLPAALKILIRATPRAGLTLENSSP